jgi:hypothetical protein
VDHNQAASMSEVLDDAGLNCGKSCRQDFICNGSNFTTLCLRVIAAAMILPAAIEAPAAQPN